MDGIRLIGYTYVDWSESAVDKKSASICCFSMGSRVVPWYNRRHKYVAFSSAEAEYMEASMATCEAIWLCKVLVTLFG